MRDLIIGLARPVMRLLGREERGAVGVIIAVLIGCGVLLGVGALAIDLGQIYQNRAELQNGADAAALAVASNCALGNTCTSAATLPAAQQYANANGRGTGYNEAISQICGTGLGNCTGPAGNGALVVCPSAPSNVSYVDVNTSTLTASGSTLLPPFFGRLLLGNGGYSGTNVKACAQAEWGPADQSSALALTISICTWDALTAGGGNPYGTDVAIVIHSSKDAGSCKGPAGQTYPGGFDWLCPNTSGIVGATCNNNSSCSTNITLSSSGTYYTAQSSTGNKPPPPCNTVIPQDLNQVVYLPVFSGAITPQGHNTEYLLVGLAAFKLTGWANLATVTPKSSIPSPEPSGCSASDVCVFGEFTQALVPVSHGVGSPGSGNFGAEAVQLSG